MTDAKDHDSAGEERLAELLREIADQPQGPGPRASLQDDVLRTARWQHTVRGSLVAVAELTSVVATGVRLLAGGPSPSPKERS